MLPHRRSIYSLYLVAFIDLFAVSLFLPLLSREIRDLGGDPFLIGVIGSIYGGVQLFSSPLMGWGSDRYGSKLVLFMCLLTTAVAYTLQGYAKSLIPLLIARIVAGCFKHTQTISRSILADLAPNDKSHVIGSFNAFGSMGFIVGPTIGAHLVEKEGGFFTVCALAAVGFLLNIVILMISVSTSKRQSSSHHKGPKLKDDSYDSSFSPLRCLKRSFSQSSSSSNPLPYTVAEMFLLKFVYSSSTILPRANLPLILEAKFQTSVVQIGYLNSLQGLVSTLVGFAVGPVTSKFYNGDSEPMVKAAGVLKTISLLGMVFAPTFPMAALSILIQNAADPFLRVGIISMSLDGHDDPGTILGLGQTATSLSRMIAPFAAGVAQSASEDGPAVVGTAASLIGLTWCYLIGKSKHRFWRWKNHPKVNKYTFDENGAIIDDFNKKDNNGTLFNYQRL